MIKQEFLERIKALPDVFMLASLVQFKYVQTIDRKSTRLNSSHEIPSRMPSSA